MNNTELFYSGYNDNNTEYLDPFDPVRNPAKSAAIPVKGKKTHRFIHRLPPQLRLIARNLPDPPFDVLEDGTHPGRQCKVWLPAFAGNRDMGAVCPFFSRKAERFHRPDHLFLQAVQSVKISRNTGPQNARLMFPAKRPETGQF